MKIKSIKKIPYKGFVHNLSVKNDETFFANNILVHNCRSVLIPITKEEIQDQSIYGATDEQNKEFFPEGKFQESDTLESDFDKEPGGFWSKK